MTRLRPYLKPVVQRQYLWRKWRMMAVWWGLMAAVACLVVGLSASGALLPDHTVGWIVFILITGTIGALLVNRRQSEVDYRQVARDIEEKHPELHATLLTAVEQKPDPKTGKFHFLQERVIDKAADAFVETGFAKTVPTKELSVLRSCSWVFLMIFCIVLSQVDQPTLSGVSATQAKEEENPVGDKLARLDKVDPGDAEVERGSPLAVLAHFSEGFPGKAALVVTPRDGEVRRLMLVKNLEDPIYGATLPSVDGPFAYQVEYDGQRSEVFSVNVFEYPELERADATLSYPAYTGIPERTVEDTRRLSVVEGTRLTYRFHLNKPVAAARLVGENNESVELDAHPEQPLAELPPLVLTKTMKWKLELVDAAGRTNKISPRIEVVVYPNKGPKIRIVSPGGDQQVSPLEEITFTAEIEDDFGLLRHGLSYNLDGGAVEEFELGEVASGQLKSLASHLLALEEMKVEAGQLVSWFFWAEDTGPDGQPRRSFSDMFFAEVRPFEEIFRQGQGGESSEEEKEQQQGLSQQVEKLIKLQKQIINATWKLHRRPSGLEQDAPVLVESQYQAFQQTTELLEEAESEKAKDFLQVAADHMEKAVAHLTESTEDVEKLMPALASEQGAYQALLRLLAHEFEVNRSQSKSQSKPQPRSERSQSQLDELDLREQEDRYETESQAQRLQNAEEREQLQVLSRLKELAQRQDDLNKKLKEVENALRAAEDPLTEEDLRRELKHLREEQRRNIADLDELNQSMEKPENRSEMAQERRQVEQTRQEMNKASEQLQKGQLSQAIASGTRAQKDLEEMRDELREKTSNQFAEQMRDMRREARELSQRQQEIGEQLAKVDKGKEKRRSLTDDAPDDKKEIAEQFDQQKEKLEGLLEEVKEVVEKSELSEPLLNRKLHQSFRQAHQDQTEKSLDAASTLLREEEDALRDYSFLRSLEEVMENEPEKQELVDRLREGDFRKASKTLGDRSQRKLDNLRKGIEKAAESVLGNEAEALKFAERELRDLEEALQNEKAEATGQQDGQAEPSDSGQEGQEPGKEEPVAGKGNPDQGGQPNPESQPGKEGGQGSPQGNPGEQAEGEGEGDQEQARQPGNQPGEQPGQEGQPGQKATNQPGQGGQQPGEGDQQPGEQPGQQAGNQPGQQPGQLSFLEKGFGPNGGGSNPITGGKNREWTDRLRDVEEAVGISEVRERVSQVREDIRKMSREFRRHSKEPEWDLVDADILKPLNEIRRQLAEELAKLKSDKALVPIDRDPVPDKFDELVRRYYERLGKGK